MQIINNNNLIKEIKASINNTIKIQITDTLINNLIIMLINLPLKEFKIKHSKNNNLKKDPIFKNLRETLFKMKTIIIIPTHFNNVTSNNKIIKDNRELRQ